MGHRRLRIHNHSATRSSHLHLLHLHRLVTGRLSCFGNSNPHRSHFLSLRLHRRHSCFIPILHICSSLHRRWRRWRYSATPCLLCHHLFPLVSLHRHLHPSNPFSPHQNPHQLLHRGHHHSSLRSSHFHFTPRHYHPHHLCPSLPLHPYPQSLHDRFRC